MITLRAYNRGFSLLSILIATAIGIFIMGVAGKIYVDTSTTFRARSSLSAVAENGRFALQDLRRTLIMVGRNIGANEDEVGSARPFAPVSAEGTVDGGGSGSDIVAIRYRTGPSCAGNLDIPSTDPPATIRYLVTDDELQCQIDDEPPITVVSGIRLMKVLYGVDDTADGSADRYLTADVVDNLPPPAGRTHPWVNVVALRIGLVTTSEETDVPGTLRGSTGTLDVLGMPYTPADDSKFYKVATATISLRNLNTIMQRQ